MRVKVRWSGFVGAPGFSVFHLRDFSGTGEPTQAQAQAAVDKVSGALTPLLPYLPQTVILRPEADVDVLEETTGVLKEILGVTAPAQQVGTAANTVGYSAATGAVVNWRTNGVRNGRRIRGKTFLVPLNGNAFSIDGSPIVGALTAINSFAAAMVNPAGAADLGVWARPSGPGASDGVWYVAAAYNVPDMAAVLRSRRD